MGMQLANEHCAQELVTLDQRLLLFEVFRMSSETSHLLDRLFNVMNIRTELLCHRNCSSASDNGYVVG